MRVLVACEESQAVTKAFRALGHEAYSADMLPASGGHPEWHIQGDAVALLRQDWDMLIAFPPCTDLTIAGARYFKEKIADGRQQAAADLFMAFVNADIPRIAIENPVGVMSTLYRKPDQIINPWQFGHVEKKRTCLWLKGLPLLVPSDIIPVDERREWVLKFPPTADRATLRSKTFQGIADAMAAQWGNA